MNEPDIPLSTPVPAAPCASGTLPASACYAYRPWPRHPVIGPALLVLVAVLSALLLVSNANAFNDVNAELQIAAREQRIARQEAERVAKAEAARRALVADAGAPRLPRDADRGAGAETARSASASRPPSPPPAAKKQ
ncbi:hypothetical protein [Roseateles chitosanitabidus]|uniref:hypothetical protein n=1 Tax=Roseateles chitosanitabidus TaxID=65048 RepID=UPI0008368136|nr:hypothetical protein [Roseateles chitosanitabidus]MBO9687244.1 hypothetical protein [Roseateles chitosanitabidus]